MAFFNVKVDATRLSFTLDKLPEALRARLAVTIRELADELVAEVKAAEPRRTGRLQQMTRDFVDVQESWVRGRVRVLRSSLGASEAAAAGALEYGAPGRRGAFRVRAYRRKLTQVFGRPTTSNQSVLVSSYTRKAHIRAVRFLRDPAARMLPRARLAIEAAITDAINDVTK